MELTDEQLEERRRRKAERISARRKKQAERRKKASILAGRKIDKGNPANRCRAKTRAHGNPCPMFRAILEDPVDGKMYKAATCYAHLPPKIQERFNATPVGGRVEGGQVHDRKKKPTAPEILKQMVEQEITTWIQPYFEALHAMKPIVVGNGRHARIEMFPDLRARTQAAEAIWDRIYGKPKTQTEISGPGGGAIPVEVPNDKDRQQAVAQILAEAGAIPDQQEKVKKTAMAARAAETN